VIAPDGALLGKWLVERYAGREAARQPIFLILRDPLRGRECFLPEFRFRPLLSRDNPKWCEAG
jgi:hypothetical protein